ncbi:MAG: hypothetical protein ACJA0H_001555, partial [Francisellaceae bacterium]
DKYSLHAQQAPRVVKRRPKSFPRMSGKRNDYERKAA